MKAAPIHRLADAMMRGILECDLTWPANVLLKTNFVEFDPKHVSTRTWR
jgi:hypothetical protein